MSEFAAGVPLANLDTGLALRNKHMRKKHLDVAKYPRAELVVDKSTLNSPGGGYVTGEATTDLRVDATTLAVPRASSSFALRLAPEDGTVRWLVHGDDGANSSSSGLAIGVDDQSVFLVTRENARAMFVARFAR